eukprot:2486620-Pleurochrysis_carterae.AAC.3
MPHLPLQGSAARRGSTNACVCIANLSSHAAAPMLRYDSYSTAPCVVDVNGMRGREDARARARVPVRAGTRMHLCV